MKHNGKLNFLSFLSYHPICQLGINSLSTSKCKCYLVLGMFTNLGVNRSLFSTSDPIFPITFWSTACLQKKSHLVAIFFFPPFYLNTNSAFDNVQGSIFPYKQFCLWEFCNSFFLELSSCIIILLLDTYLRLDGIIIFNTRGRPIQRHGHIFNMICIGKIITITRK